MVATTVLIWTVVPSAILISFKVPAAGEGISASTLSVEISKSGSSRWTVSPGFLSHLVMVPSVMDSPIWGMTTSVGMNFFSLKCRYGRLKPLIQLDALRTDSSGLYGGRAVDGPTVR